MTLDELNSLPDNRAIEELLKVCGSREWAREMEASRPFETLIEAIERGEELWVDLSREDRLQAFAAHPRIGDRSGSRWSQEEQKGVHGDDSLWVIQARNALYEQRFGHVFLICATGKSAPEILSELNRRLENTPEKELEIASQEQVKIMRIRMEKLITP
jgi:OHCU decarboxylase